MAAEFAVSQRGEGVEGLAKGVDRRHLERLRRGEPEPAFELDLHGLVAAEARRSLRAAVLEAHEEGARTLLVVHGRGRGSEAGPVLREGLATWLSAPPVGRLVMAFTPARPADGGAGASYVLLRRNRAGA